MPKEKTKQMILHERDEHGVLRARYDTVSLPKKRIDHPTPWEVCDQTETCSCCIEADEVNRSLEGLWDQERSVLATNCCFVQALSEQGRAL